MLHPDHQEVHLQTARPRDAGADVAAGARRRRRRSTTRGDAVAVKNLTLRQRRPADCRRRRVRPAGRRAEGDADERRSRERRRAAAAPAAAGRARSTRRRTVTGTKDAPDVNGRFPDRRRAASASTATTRFGGTVNYAGPGLTLDTKLQQNPTTFLTAKGYVPTALFKGGDGGRPRRGARRAGGAGRPASTCTSRARRSISAWFRASRRR